ncbi:hypothetical protein [Fibrisoma montanum]|nr:hypothetical protein [Fibrisoma montanum]
MADIHQPVGFQKSAGHLTNFTVVAVDWADLYPPKPTPFTR